MQLSTISWYDWTMKGDSVEPGELWLWWPPYAETGSMTQLFLVLEIDVDRYQPCRIVFFAGDGTAVSYASCSLAYFHSSNVRRLA